MRSKFFILLLTVFCTAVFAQTHASISLDNQIYYILEQAQLRGLCSTLPGTKPYTHSIVISAIREICASEHSHKLNDTEWEILLKYLNKFSKPKIGFDFLRGGYYNETKLGKVEMPISGNIGVYLDIEGSAGFYDSFKENYFGTDLWIGLFANGDLSSYISYNFIFEGGLVQVPRRVYPEEYNTYYDGFTSEPESEYQNKKIETYSEPLTHFPYSYRKRWDSSVYFFSDIAGYNYWPNSIAGGYSLLSELTASFLEDKLIIRAGRLPREWGSTQHGSSLFFNQSARPFYAFETYFNPVSWLSFSSLAGILEYLNNENLKAPSSAFQNAFALNLLQLRFRNYVFFDFADVVVYPKRFEPGYMIPIINNFFYQNNTGDFDNMALSFSLKAQYPGIGYIWGSFFLDEMNFLDDIKTLDRQMFTVQAGATFFLPFLSFSSFKFSYTKVNPYCYTHPRNFNPWYGDKRMETAYINNGVSLGYYLPPNSDEFLLRFETMPVKTLSANIQYQLIRRGADFGSSAVDGSNLSSELNYYGLTSEPELKRFFLKDGAYQWLHIIKLGGEWFPEKMPFAINCEIGIVISYFTNIEGKANSGSPSNYSIIDTAEYPKSTGFIAKLGIKLYPKN